VSALLKFKIQRASFCGSPRSSSSLPPPRPPLCPRVGHKAKRRARVWCSLPMLRPRAPRQRYASVLYLPTKIHSLVVNKHSSSSASPPLSPPLLPFLSTPVSFFFEGGQGGGARERGFRLLPAPLQKRKNQNPTPLKVWVVDRGVNGVFRGLRLTVGPGCWSAEAYPSPSRVCV
jgi:hypothetical protein